MILPCWEAWPSPLYRVQEDDADLDSLCMRGHAVYRAEPTGQMFYAGPRGNAHSQNVLPLRI